MITRGRLKGEAGQNESALRHKVRNLRAKVRLLLPLQVCCKQLKRGKNMMKLVHNKESQQQHRLKRWCHARQSCQQIFIPHQSKNSQKHLFHKLTSQQLQQIKEDKMYYLGEDFIKQFDDFIELREKSAVKKQKNMMKNQSMEKSHINSTQQLAKYPNLHKKQSSDLSQFVQQQKQNQVDWHFKHTVKLQSMREKKKIINEEDLTRRVIIKMKLRQKEERIRLNHQKMAAAKVYFIREKNKINQMRTSQSIRSKNNLKQIGQISDLSQKLRGICLMRATNSANLLFRS